MKSITLLLMPLLFLSSCTIDWNGEKDAKIAELEKQIQDDTFKKGQECATFMNEVQDEYKKKTEESSANYYTVEEIFYSKDRNSCVAKIYESIYNSPMESSLNKYTLKDLLTYELINTATINCSDVYNGNEDSITTCLKALDDFNKNIKNLKGQ